MIISPSKAFVEGVGDPQWVTLKLNIGFKGSYYSALYCQQCGRAVKMNWHVFHSRRYNIKFVRNIQAQHKMRFNRNILIICYVAVKQYYLCVFRLWCARSHAVFVAMQWPKCRRPCAMRRNNETRTRIAYSMEIWSRGWMTILRWRKERSGLWYERRTWTMTTS